MPGNSSPPGATTRQCRYGRQDSPGIHEPATLLASLPNRKVRDEEAFRLSWREFKTSKQCAEMLAGYLLRRHTLRVCPVRPMHTPEQYTAHPHSERHVPVEYRHELHLVAGHSAK